MKKRPFQTWMVLKTAVCYFVTKRAARGRFNHKSF